VLLVTIAKKNALLLLVLMQVTVTNAETVWPLDIVQVIAIKVVVVAVQLVQLPLVHEQVNIPNVVRPLPLVLRQDNMVKTKVQLPLVHEQAKVLLVAAAVAALVPLTLKANTQWPLVGNLVVMIKVNTV
jgi:hypothetical protein